MLICTAGVNRARLFSSAVLLAVLAVGAVSAQSTGAFLSTGFSPQYHANQKTMGLLQRNFLDLVEDDGDKLQVAIVIDATDSMGDDLKGVRDSIENMVTDLERYRGKGNVHVAFVLYRDVEAKSGPVTFLTRGFVNDASMLKSQMAKVVAEEGKPYFYEVPDKGVHDAISELPWDEAPTTTKWLFLFGDAPPYDVTFVDTRPNGKAQRFYDSTVIAAAAKKRNIKISCVLCKSREYDNDVYAEVLPKTRQFMNSISSATGGLMLDLSYPDIQKALQDAAKEPRVSQTKIPSISQDEINSIRKIAHDEKQLIASNRRQTVAVLPFQPFNKIDFDTNKRETLIATELRHYLRRLPGFEVNSPREVDRAVLSLKRAGLSDADFLKRLSRRLGSTMVVYGRIEPEQGVVKATGFVYSRATGTTIKASVVVGQGAAQVQLVNQLTARLRSTIQSSNSTAPEHLVLARAAPQSEITRVANTVEEHTLVLKALESLERALEFSAGSESSVALLADAEKSLTRLRQTDLTLRDDPFVNQLLANCYYNQAAYLRKKGDTAGAKSKAAQVRQRLVNAYSNQEKAAFDGVKQEVIADYALLISKEYDKAFKRYEALTRTPANETLHLRRRAHWMLYGMYAGDWGVPKNLADEGKAKKHALQILAHWPNSPEAKAIKEDLRFNEDEGVTKYSHVQQKNSDLAKQVGDE